MNYKLLTHEKINLGDYILTIECIPDPLAFQWFRKLFGMKLQENSFTRQYIGSSYCWKKYPDLEPVWMFSDLDNFLSSEYEKLECKRRHPERFQDASTLRS